MQPVVGGFWYIATFAEEVIHPKNQFTLRFVLQPPCTLEPTFVLAFAFSYGQIFNSVLYALVPFYVSRSRPSLI